MALKRLVVAAAVLAGCAAQEKRLVIPPELRRPPQAPVQVVKGGVTPAAFNKDAREVAQPSDARGSDRSVVRLVEHGRVWELDLPEHAGGYELRIPLGESIAPPSNADTQVLRAAPSMKNAPGYLASLARVNDLYGAHRYELALIEAVELEGAYPQEPRLQAMKGSLLRKLGRPRGARDAWRKALSLDPNDAAVAEALRELEQSGVPASDDEKEQH